MTAYLFSAWHRESEFAIYDLYREIAHKSNALKSGKVFPVKEYVILPGTRVLGMLRLCRPGVWCCFRVDLSAKGKGNGIGGFRGIEGGAKDICFGEDAAMNTLIDCGCSATAADVLSRAYRAQD